jgi:hypothetical protein
LSPLACRWTLGIGGVWANRRQSREPIFSRCRRQELVLSGLGGHGYSPEESDSLWSSKSAGEKGGPQKVGSPFKTYGETGGRKGAKFGPSSEDVRSDIRGCPFGHQRRSVRTSGCPQCPPDVRTDIRMSVWTSGCPFGHPGDIGDIRMSERTSSDVRTDIL